MILQGPFSVGVRGNKASVSVIAEAVVWRRSEESYGKRTMRGQEVGLVRFEGRL